MDPRPSYSSDQDAAETVDRILPPVSDTTQIDLVTPVPAIIVTSVVQTDRPLGASSVVDLLQHTGGVEYQTTPDLTPPDTTVGALEVVISIVSCAAVLSLVGSIIRCVQVKRK